MQEYPKIHFKVAEIRGEKQGRGVFTYPHDSEGRGGQLPPLGLAETTPLPPFENKILVTCLPSWKANWGGKIFLLLAMKFS